MNDLTVRVKVISKKNDLHHFLFKNNDFIMTVVG